MVFPVFFVCIAGFMVWEGNSAGDAVVFDGAMQLKRVHNVETVINKQSVLHVFSVENSTLCDQG